jgi:hypothetical protein
MALHLLKTLVADLCTLFSRNGVNRTEPMFGGINGVRELRIKPRATSNPGH